ncbi:hypothetical protein SK803_03450 [Lentzea sp. BCCO 10_0856]|uniref:Uncharacterized protein n=1 Tax=Lentzea miocenica TaxID=3095431 RepID=A0ABU4STK9_9PSEU|nr:hypothetical protein [Lentzea sp. BCCO 10_0856]MDX8029246.1 hypothetical protein [Lentzea sp. BCCO 10_0856]
MTLDDMSLQQVRVTALEKLDNAVCTALANIEADDARTGLREALAGCLTVDAVVPQQVLASVQAADEHLGYGERLEARTLLTVAHRMLSRVQRPVVVPSPALPGDVALRG